MIVGIWYYNMLILLFRILQKADTAIFTSYRRRRSDADRSPKEHITISHKGEACPANHRNSRISGLQAAY